MAILEIKRTRVTPLLATGNPSITPERRPGISPVRDQQWSKPMLRVWIGQLLGPPPGHGPGRKKKTNAFHLYPQMNTNGFARCLRQFI
jgi:hypothetical protein